MHVLSFQTSVCQNGPSWNCSKSLVSFQCFRTSWKCMVYVYSSKCAAREANVMFSKFLPSASRYSSATCPRCSSVLFSRWVRGARLKMRRNCDCEARSVCNNHIQTRGICFQIFCPQVVNPTCVLSGTPNCSTHLHQWLHIPHVCHWIGPIINESKNDFAIGPMTASENTLGQTNGNTWKYSLKPLNHINQMLGQFHKVLLCVWCVCSAIFVALFLLQLFHGVRAARLEQSHASKQQWYRKRRFYDSNLR